MGHPELNSDESILLATQNIVVKSVPFEAILTNERLILVNSRDTLMPPQYIPLAAILSLEQGENAIRDPTITVSISTETGSARQMVLTFSRHVGSERKRECDEWVKLLRDKMASYSERSIRAVVPPFEPEQVSAPTPGVQPQVGIAGGSSAKKRIEIARPMKKIIETVNAPQKPKETSTLPQGSFCSRCGSRVSPDSLFCNRCGTRVAGPQNQQVPGPEPAEPSVPQVSVPVAPTVSPVSRKERPIEDVIHSIEPLIEDSKPRTQPSPLVPSRHPTQSVTQPVPEKVAEQSPAASPAEEVGEPDPIQKNLLMFSNILVQKTDDQAPVIPETSSADGTSVTPLEVASNPSSAPVVPSPPPQPATQRSSKKPMFMAIALIIIVVIAVVIGASTFMNNAPGAGILVPAPTPVITTLSTPLPTTVIHTATPTPVITKIVPTQVPTPAALVIPKTGVWVRVKYAGTFTGSFGTPGNLHDVTGSGEQLYQIPTSTGVVVTSFVKDDGSGDLILTEVYKDGVLVKSESTTTPNGIAQIQVDLKATAPPTSLATNVSGQGK